MAENLNLKTVNTIYTRPFKRLIMTIGELPTSFIESMTYYELLAWFVHYLDTVIIPTVNNNAEAVAELQNLFTQLKDFVDNYFDNLDVQDEIDNKLDEMAEEGELQRIIADYLKTQVIYDTTLDMIDDASNLVNGVRVETLGYRTVDDNGASFFVIKDTGTANGYSVIDLGNGLYAHMIYKHDYVTPEMFGAYGDGQQAHDDSAAIQFAVNTGKTVEFSKKTYMCYNILISSPCVLHGNGCVLKRPNLQIEPYNMTSAQTEKVNTIKAHEDCVLESINFDNDCFSNWQVSDQHSQARSACVEIYNASKVIEVKVNDCSCSRSAGDGLWIIAKSNTEVNNFRSTDCFRGGITVVGLSKVTVNNWVSTSATLGMFDGINTELTGDDTGTEHMDLSVNNMITNGQVKVQIPVHSTGTLNNIIQMPFAEDTYRGFTFSAVGGVLNVSNSILRTGVPGSAQMHLNKTASISIANSTILGNSTDPVFNLQTDGVGQGDKKLLIKDCIIKGATCMTLAIYEVDVEFDGCDIDVTGQMIGNRGNTAPQPRNMIISNCKIKFGDRLFNTNKSADVTWSEGVNYRLSNLTLTGNAGSDIQISGQGANIWYNNLIMSGAQKLTLGGAAAPNFYGQGRVITVPTASDLNFKGWVAGDDIAIALDTGARYRYTSGTTWTAI